MSKSRNHPVLPKCWDYNSPDETKHVPPMPFEITNEARFEKGLRDVIACKHDDAETLRIIAISALGGRQHER